LFVSTIIFSVVVVYWRDLAILLDDAVGNEMANYILALPFLSAFMIYKKRSILKADLFFENEKKRETLLRDIVGISLSLSALFLYIYGSFSFNILEYHLISLILFVTGCAVFLLGIRNLVNLILPIGLLLLLLVPYREEAYQVSSQLSVLTSDITFRLLKTLGYPVSLSSLYESPAIVMQTLSGQEVPFVVDIPCAGAYSLIGFSVFAIFFAFISQGSVQKKATWLIIGFALIYSANIARIALTSVLGYWYNIEIAMELFHLLSGSVLIFIVSLLIIFLGEKILKIRVFKTVEDDVDNCPLCDENRTMGEDFCDFCGKFLNPIKNIITVSALGKILICSIFMAILINMQVSTFSLTTTNVMELDIQELTGNKEALGFLP